MKKIYIVLLSGILTGQLHSQTLTKAANEPLPGDIFTSRQFDSTSAMPRTTGINQTWDFSSLVPGFAMNATTYVAVSSVPSSSLFPTATIAETSGAGDYTFYKSASTPTTQFEVLGAYSSGPPASSSTFSNTFISMVWPVSFGSTFNDNFSGSVSGLASGAISGSQTITATGTGTLKLPGGLVFSNVLQLKLVTITSQTFTGSFSSTLSAKQTEYIYYHSSQKFPLLNLSAGILSDGTDSDTLMDITINKAVVVGIKENSLDYSDLAVFPNPAKNNLNVSLSNKKIENGSIEIYSVTGQMVKSVIPKSSTFINETIDITGLTPGIYLVKTALGGRSSTRRVVVE